MKKPADKKRKSVRKVTKRRSKVPTPLGRDDIGAIGYEEATSLIRWLDRTFGKKHGVHSVIVALVNADGAMSACATTTGESGVVDMPAHVLAAMSERLESVRLHRVPMLEPKAQA